MSAMMALSKWPAALRVQSTGKQFLQSGGQRRLLCSCQLRGCILPLVDRVFTEQFFAFSGYCQAVSAPVFAVWFVAQQAFTLKCLDGL